jgi:hypothetical protein
MLELNFPFSPIIIPLTLFPKMMIFESAYTNTIKHFHIFLKIFKIMFFNFFGRQSALSCLKKKKDSTADKQSSHLNRSLFLSRIQPYLQQLFHL